MKYHASQTVTVSGRYAVAAARVADTDLLSVYVDRVKKLGATSDDQQTIDGILHLKDGDLVESTGTLSLQRIVD